MAGRNRRLSLGKRLKIDGIQDDTYYTFEGVSGQFLHFKNYIDPYSPPKGYLAITSEFPSEGKRLKCRRLEKGFWNPMLTSTVQVARQMAINLYVVQTENSIYFVQVK